MTTKKQVIGDPTKSGGRPLPVSRALYAGINARLTIPAVVRDSWGDVPVAAGVLDHPGNNA